MKPWSEFSQYIPAANISDFAGMTSEPLNLLTTFCTAATLHEYTESPDHLPATCVRLCLRLTVKLLYSQ